MSTTGSGTAQRLLDDQIEPFLQHLRDAGYAERTLRKKRTVASLELLPDGRSGKESPALTSTPVT
jgi:hypothetical protein